MSKENSVPSLEQINAIYSLLPSGDPLPNGLCDESQTTETLGKVPDPSLQTHNGQVMAESSFGVETNSPAYEPKKMPVSYETETQVGATWAEVIMGKRAAYQANITSQRQMEWK